jgi:hypothetical protein
VQHDLLRASSERARQLAAEDQQLGDEPRLQPFAIEPAISVYGRYRLEDRRPLIAVDRASDTLSLGQKDMVFDVE